MRDYVLIYINKNPLERQETEELLQRFAELRIRHKVVDLNGKINLYGNETSLEGLFALDFSDTDNASIPRTPLAVAAGKLYSGSHKISENLEYFRQNFSEINR